MADESKPKRGPVAETISTLFWALLIAGVFRTLFFQPFWIPSASMKDTLLIGDFLFVNKMAYGYSRYSCPFAICPISGRIFGSDPEIGDVVVFRHPTKGEDYIKRLIGKAGDRIQMKDGVLYINDVMVPQEQAGTFTEPYERQGSMGTMPSCIENRRDGKSLAEGETCSWDRARETLPNGVEHNILNIGDGQLDNTPVFVVPDGHYFFMGDNRDDSTDSRVDANAGGVDFVPEEYILGRAERVMFSSAGRRLVYFWTWRADRFFHKIE